MRSNTAEKRETQEERDARLNKKSGTISATVEIPRRYLAYQCMSADIAYWARNVKFKKVLDDDTGGLHIITVLDEYDECTGKKIATHKLDWARAIKLVVESPALGWMLPEDRMDMTTGDNWVQLAALGELRYG